MWNWSSEATSQILKDDSLLTASLNHVVSLQNGLKAYQNFEASSYQTSNSAWWKGGKSIGTGIPFLEDWGASIWICYRIPQCCHNLDCKTHHVVSLHGISVANTPQKKRNNDVKHHHRIPRYLSLLGIFGLLWFCFLSCALFPQNEELEITGG